MAHDHASHDHAVRPGQPFERRFASAPTRRSNYRALLGGLGAATLGAATWANWVREVPLPSAEILFGVGTVAVIGAALISDPNAWPIRVGEGGVAIERNGTQPDRIAWYEVEHIRLEDGSVVVESSGKRIAASTDTHEAAAAWILKEALDRIPAKVEIDSERTPFLMRAADDHGEIIPFERPQVAGRRCRASGTLISFEQDARLCARCGEVYDRKHAPEECLACGAPLAS